jgi:hypothetical protein
MAMPILSAAQLWRLMLHGHSVKLSFGGSAMHSAVCASKIAHWLIEPVQAEILKQLER